VFVPIDDRSDARLAPFRDVGNPAALQRAGLFVAEGRLVVRRLIEDGRYPVERVLVTPAARDALRDLFAGLAAPVVVAPQGTVNEITGFNFHRGCLALARRPSSAATLDAVSSATRLLALEGVANPDNVGGVFRTAFALGAGGVLLDATSGDPFYRKAIRTSMAATLRLPFARATAWPEALGTLRSSGFRLIALTPAPDAIPIDEVADTSPARVALLLGSEGDGLSAAALALADVRARIPVEARADSLNVVVAAGIALHALRP
jgi:tRNA G18 (ribose-2'-O)-methylase SpoU